ncbi:hypothetical protein [Mesorhizobium argentiipisi]|uniref:Uncharacterized protein n=1 Tax=Mesorhizobium argentiipisi TaxID=3015175 RepID=A0ABU8KMB6_9HYPH
MFEKLEALVQAQDASAAAREARSLLTEIDRRGSAMVSAAVDDFLIDMLTMAFVAEAFGGGVLEAARRLAQKRLSKIKLLSAVLPA